MRQHKMVQKHVAPEMTVADFKDRIRQIKRAGEGLAILGAPRAHPCVVRKNKSEGARNE